MIFKSDRQRRAVFSKLSGSSRLEAELKPMLAPTWREAVDFENLYNPALSYAQNKKYAIKELSVMLDNKESASPECGCDSVTATQYSEGEPVMDAYSVDVYNLVQEPKQGLLSASLVTVTNPVDNLGDRIANAFVKLYPDLPAPVSQVPSEINMERPKLDITDRFTNAIVGLYPEPIAQEVLVEDEITPSGEVVIVQPVQRKSVSDSIADAVTSLWP